MDQSEAGKPWVGWRRAPPTFGWPWTPVPPLYDIVPPPGATVFAGVAVGVAVGVAGLPDAPAAPTADGTLAGGGNELGVNGAVGVAVGVTGLGAGVGGAWVGASVGVGLGGGSASTAPRLAASA